MLNKFLLIGLGGSGEKLIRFLNQDVEQRLNNLDWDGGVPKKAWRWVSIDVAQRPDVAKGNVPAGLGDGTRLGLAEAPLDYADYFHQTTGDPAVLPALGGALPSPTVELPPPFMGAGQRPQVGSLVGVNQLRTIADEISRQITVLGSPEATDELAELSARIGVEGDADEPRTNVIVAASLGGGSGSGLVQLVVELLLGHAAEGAQWLRQGLSTLLFTPDMFQHLSPPERDGVQANSLHTVSTMINGYEWDETVDPALARLLGTGGAILPRGRRAATTNFYIGARNASIAFDHQDSVIAATARGLGRMLVDERVAGAFAEHLDANRDGSPVAESFTLVEPAATSRPVSSFGYASISLGDSLLTEYATERLALGQIDTVIRGHRAFAESESEREDATIERVARERLDWFLEAAGLRRQDVLAALFDRDALRDEVRADVEEIKDDVAKGSRKAKGDSWKSRIGQRFEKLQKESDARRQADREVAARDWSVAADERLRAAAALAIARFGGPVAIELVDIAAARVADLASELDRDRREKLLPQSNGFLDKGLNLLNGIATRKVRSDDKALAEATEARGKALFLGLEADYNELAARLVRDFAAAVLPALGESIAAGVAQLRESVADHDRLLVERWSATSVPSHLLPASNQLMLEPVAGVPELLERLLEETTGVRGARNAEAAAVAEMLTGDWRAEDEDRRAGSDLVRLVGAWSPGGAGRARYSVALDAPGVLARARAWVTRRRGALAERRRLPLATWMRDPGNATRFAAALDQAIRHAAPLMSVNPTVHMRVHGRPMQDPKLYVSALPIDPDSSIRPRVEQSLRAAGISDGDLAGLFDPGSAVSNVEVSGFLAQPVLPVVVDGLFVPIQRDWQGRTNTAMRAQFCAYRRTRPLPLFVPLSPERQLRFVKGWIAGSLLGAIDIPSDGWRHGPPEVWSPTGMRRFPAHPLGKPPASEEGVLACVLESMPLAMASYAAQQYEELEAYMRVLELGDLGALGHWVAEGEPEPPQPGHAAAPEPNPSRAGSAGDTPETRRSVVIGWLDRMVGEHARRRAQHQVTRETIVQLGPDWEIAELVEEALGEVRSALRAQHDWPSNGQDPAAAEPLAQ